MTNNNSQNGSAPLITKGFAMPIVIAIVVLVVIVAGVGYFAIQKQSKKAAEFQEKALIEKEAMEKKEQEAMMEKKENEAMMKKPVTVALNALNNSGEQGTAVLSNIEGKTKVVLSISGAPASTPQPAHIHTGSCPNPGAVKYPLTSLTNGASETILDIPLTKILGELPLAVNVHKSAADAKIYVSCGNIPSEKYTGTVLAGKSAPLLDFTKADYDTAVKSDKLVALYFVANWCPVCKVELPKLYTAFNELTTDKVIGFQINYNDSDTDADEKNLAREFGVAYQHTKVFLKNGKQILKSPESWSKEQHLSEINKAVAQ